ncbi:MAG: tandem-95 repeat protein [Ignavibacteriales bacterium]|nr:tandem-95 repeat protein [Ignavibacteriales bacterium]
MKDNSRILFSILLFFVSSTVTFSQYNFYFGDIHSHTWYSDGNQDQDTLTYSTPVARAITYGRDNAGNFDFLGVSDHNHREGGLLMNLSRWNAGFDETDSINQDGVFVGMYGQEWGTISTGGHALIYGTDKLYGWEAGVYDVYVAKGNYDMLFDSVKRYGGFIYLAHPDQSDFDGIFTGSYNASWDSVVSGVALKNGPSTSTNTTETNPASGDYSARYHDLLKLGYHVAPCANQDNHNTTFGRVNQQRTVVLAPSLTRTNVLDALRNRRTYATEDHNLQIQFEVGTHRMGEIFTHSGAINFRVKINDSDVEQVSTIQLRYGVPGSGSAPTTLTSATNRDSLIYTYNQALNSTYYFYVYVQQADGNEAWSAPMWITSSNVSVPNAVTLVSPSDAINNLSTSLQVKWNSSSSATSYRLQLGTDSTFVSGMVLDDSTIVDTFKNVSNLSYGTKYYWRVRAKNIAGSSTYSSGWRFSVINVIQSSSSTNGTISPSGNVTVSFGGNQSFTMNPSTGYHIDSLIIDGSPITPVSNYSFTNVTTNKTIRSTFSINQYIIVATSVGNGSISPNDTAIVDYGNNYTFTFSPGSGYFVDSVRVDGTYIGAPSNYTFTNVNVAHTLYVKFRRLNTPPIAQSQSLSTNEDIPKSFTVAATDNENDVLSYAIVDSAKRGTITGTLPNIIFSPSQNYFGSDSLRFSVYDGEYRDSEKVFITINSVNDAPIASDQNFSVNEDITLSGTLTATDVDNPTLTYTIISQGSKGTITITNATTGAFSYVPNSNINGTDSLTFRVTDGQLHDTAKVKISILSINDAPVTRDTSISTNEDIQKSLSFTASDVDGQTISYSIVRSPLHGTISSEGGNVYIYQPHSNFFGRDTLSYRAFDGTLSDTGFIFINIVAVNDRPIAVSFSDSILRNSPMWITLLGTDVENSILSYSISTAPQHGSLDSLDTENWKVLYLPSANYTGKDSFGIVASDGELTSTQAFISITIFSVYDSTKYRTFTQTEWAVKSVKLPKKGIRPMPTAGNVLDTVFTKAFPKLKDKSNPKFPGGMVLGIMRTDSVKHYGWIRLIGKGKDAQKFLPHSAPARGLDNIAGKKFVKELKNPKVDKFNNILAGELLALKANIAASAFEINPEGIGSLIFKDAAEPDNILNEKTLSEIVLFVDTTLTYYKQYYGVATTAPEMYNEITQTLQRINSAFSGPIDTFSVSPLKLKAVTALGEYSFLYRSSKENIHQHNLSRFEEKIDDYALLQNYPNPFNPSTRFRFVIPDVGLVTLKIYNILGKEISTLISNQELESGEHEIGFSANGIPSGVYFYTLNVQSETNSFHQTKKFLLMK